MIIYLSCMAWNYGRNSECIKPAKNQLAHILRVSLHTQHSSLLKLTIKIITPCTLWWFSSLHSELVPVIHTESLIVWTWCVHSRSQTEPRLYNITNNLCSSCAAVIIFNAINQGLYVCKICSTGIWITGRIQISLQAAVFPSIVWPVTVRSAVTTELFKEHLVTHLLVWINCGAHILAPLRVPIISPENLCIFPVCWHVFLNILTLSNNKSKKV